ncbi:hypothetical protein ASF87_03390 [Microbacterium sp. Leaf161]|uniref:lantibiotic dehydratase C-terminal domain-containing protein n=1 Tax=Microbacterium sp. Leaf161 TaxID=1736281 RepID=UPI0006FDEC86|nr:lantibiotic dehydratase C-terminal domain-containing protein [Microbacterium sp. Leaf161]KQR47997.1 hypothetical protein ASF87_03390 [Microbacterium sp. Leaf161]
MTIDWTSLHVYCHSPQSQDRLITGVADALAVEPTHWFFVRYWLHGPHVRFRFAEPSAAEKVRAYAVRTLANSDSADLTAHDYYAKISPHLREGHEVSDATPWYTTGTVRDEVYTPELQRYGAGEAMAAAEKAFVSSSRLAVDVIRASGSRASRLAAAAYVMNAVVERMGFVDEFSRYGGFWSRSSRRIIPADAVGAVLSPIRAGAVLSDVETGLAEWIEDLEATRPLLAEAAPLVLASQIHMTNNRLGVPIEWEAALGSALWGDT